jgi:hypothetical protein
LLRKVRAAEAAVEVVGEQAQDSVRVEAALAACPEAVARALAASAPVVVAGRDHPAKLAAVFGKAAAAQGAPAGD